MSVNDLFEEVLQLSPASRASLVEKIVESIAADIDPVIEKSHLEEIRRRKEQVFSEKHQLISEDEVLQRARSVMDT